MNIFILKKKGWIAGAVLGICLLLYFSLNLIGYFMDLKYISVFAAAAEVDKFQVRSGLLMDATNFIGVCRPEEAAEVWANGLKMRSAAMQYSVMTKKLKDEYAKQLDQTFPNWVTGMSSPWVDSFHIIKTQSQSPDKYIIEILFSTMTSTGPAGEYIARLTIVREDDFWRIENITMDQGLYPYTGFRPN